jgi:tripartite-type tricarboxylate transporter receptor subunit TctC
MSAFQRIAAAIVAGVAAAPIAAQDASTHSGKPYPTKFVRVITGGAGNMHDIILRQLGQRLTERWGQSVVVENRGGAGLTIGTAMVARATPDGYTLLMSDRTAIAVAPSAFKGLSYDPLKDLAPITLVARAPLLVVAHPSLPAAKLRELIDYARQRPGVLSYAAAGPASANHIAGELFKQMASVEITAVNYKGTPAAMLAVVSGEVKMGFGMVPVVLPPRERRKAARVCHHQQQALFRIARRPDLGRSGPAGLRIGLLDRNACSCTHAGAGHREAQHRHRLGIENTRVAVVASRARF